jgi:nucleoside-diphosphate-sugar epimerase
MRTILVTGAGGYIGTVLTRMLLMEGYAVVALDRFFFGKATQLLPNNSHLRIVAHDIRTVSADIMAGIHAVVDLAALSNDPAGDLAPELTRSINIYGRSRIADMACNAGVERYILSSSCSVYGSQDGIMHEESPVAPLTIYAACSYEAEKHLLALSRDNWCATVLRNGTVFGVSPRMRFDLAINTMVGTLWKGERLQITRDGRQWRPFVHVIDVCRAILSCLQAAPGDVSGEVFNVGSNDLNIQVLPLAEVVAEAIGHEHRSGYWEWRDSYDHRSYRVDFEKIATTLGFKALFSIADGAKEVCKALRCHDVAINDPRTITVEWYKHLLAQGVLA